MVFFFFLSVVDRVKALMMSSVELELIQIICKAVVTVWIRDRRCSESNPDIPGLERFAVRTVHASTYCQKLHEG